MKLDQVVITSSDAYEVRGYEDIETTAQRKQTTSGSERYATKYKMTLTEIKSFLQINY